MPIKNQLQVDQSIHMNICILNLYCEEKWMAVQSFHNINPGAAHRSTRVQATDGSAAHSLSYKRPKIPSKFVQCYKKSHTSQRNRHIRDPNSKNCTGKTSPSRCWPAGSLCCSSLAHCCKSQWHPSPYGS